MRVSNPLFLLLLISASPLPAAEPEDVPSPVSPADSLKYLHVRPGFRVELVAAEPLVEDPVAFDWGPDGKLWVVEMHDYPLGLDGKGKPGGRVRVLEDTDGDGRYDRSTLLADDLPFANGVLAWGKGALVTAAPHILYLEDADGDGRAETRTPLFVDFTEGNPQLRVNGLRWGLDNWVYCANGFSSVGLIKSVKTGQTADIGGRDLRIRPDEGIFDPQMGRSQFGRNRDAWGNWFGVQNANPLWHYVLDERYVRRNPHYAPPDPRIDVSIDPKQSVIYPRSRPGKFYHQSQAGRFTSANSGMIFCDDLWGETLGREFAGNSFVSEPVHNLVHREIVSPKGVTFTSQRADDEKESEFLASSDSWFRPATLRTGPDGALWIADVYRETIEHPQWIPPDDQKTLDLRAGSDRGRIYRVYPEKMKLREIPKPEGMTPAEVTALLESPNATQRDMAQQYLVTHKLASATRGLVKLATDSRLPAARMQAICTLDGLGELSGETLLVALRDEHAGVRRQAVRLCEGRFDADKELGPKLVEMAKGDQDLSVRLQLACTLGEWHDERAGYALPVLAVSNREEPFILAAVFSSLDAKNIDLFVALLVSMPDPKGERQRILATAGAIASGYGREDAAGRAMVTVVSYSAELKTSALFDATADLLDSLDKKNLSLSKILKSFKGTAVEQNLAAVFSAARAAAENAKSDEELRVSAVRLLGRAPDGREADVKRLGKLLVPQTPGSVQSAAVEALARLADAGTPKLLLAGWKGHAPALRGQMLDVLLSREAFTNDLVAALEAGRLAPSDIDAARRQRLVGHKNGEIKAAAQRLLAASANTDRQKVLADYQAALSLAGNAARGEPLFVKKCAVCHELNKQGKPVGPNLAALTDKSPKALLTAILDPNQAVEPKYLSYTAISGDGRIYVGLLADETGSGITLVDQTGNRHSLLRSELEELTSSGKSLMPEGVEKELSPQEIADVIAYVAAGGRTSGKLLQLPRDMR